MSKIILKNMSIYRLHRNNELDHKKGRPAILLKYKSKTSLIWWGTHKREENSDEMPLLIKFGKIKTYFYSKGIEKIENEHLKERWINYKTNNTYELNEQEEKQLIKTFVTFTNQKDPYQKNMLLKLENQALKNKIRILKQENERLKNEKEKNSELEFEIE